MRKATSLFLVVSVFSLLGNLMAEEWGRKFTLVNQKTDSQLIIDEFIPVTRLPFLVMKPEFSVGVFSHNKNFFNVQFQNQLKWSENSNLRKILNGVAYGALIGGSCGTFLGYAIGDDEPGGLESVGTPAWAKAFIGAAIGVVIGGIIGGIIAAI